MEKGDRVRNTRENITGVLTGETRITIMNGCQYGVLYDNGAMKFTQEIWLEKLPEFMTPHDKFKKGEGFLNYTEYRQYMTYLRLSGEFTNIYYSMKQGKVDSYDYQMKPVLKFIKSVDKRLLIADEVGLGKTVEALFIWKELVARSRANRLLIVAPAILCEKWRQDMDKLFSIKAKIVDARELLEKIKDKDNGFALITSIQGIRWKSIKDDDSDKGRPAYMLNKYIEKYSEDHPIGKLLDLIIFDEAHYLSNNSTANHITAVRFNEVSKGMLLLSATPVNGKTDEFYNLLHLMAPDDFFSKKEFVKTNNRNKKLVKLAHLFHDSPNPEEEEQRIKDIRFLLSEIQNDSHYCDDPFFFEVEKELGTVFKDTHECHKRRMEIFDKITEKYYYNFLFTRSKKKDVLPSCATRKPQTVHFELTSFEKNVYNKAIRELKKKLEENDDRLWSFCILARQRELASCMPAAIKRWTERGNIILDGDKKNLLDADEKDELDVSYEGNIQYNTVLSSYPNLADVDISLLVKNDSKFNRFLSVLREKLDAGEKVIVFSFFRGTLQYLMSRLEKNGIKTILILGGMKSEDKQDALKKFKNNEEYNVLLSSEVGAEGIDLQFARIEFNYDLPWNPMRLEQRIGRIDRIGQKSPVISIVNLSCKNTVEDRVLKLLYEKIKVCEETIGEIDEVLGEEMSEIQLELLKADMNENDLRVKEKIDKTLKAVEEITRNKVEEGIGLTKEYSDRLIQIINSAEKNYRYLKDEDFIYYIKDFFSTHGNGSSLKRNPDKKEEWILSLVDDDKNLYREFLDKNGYDSNITNGKSCSFPNYPASTAWRIDISHPLIKWINSMIKEEHKLADCYIFHVDRKNLDTEKTFSDNTYVFYVSSVEFSKALVYSNELVSIATGVNSDEILSRDDTDYLLSAALYFGKETSSMSLELSNLKDIREKALEKSMDSVNSLQDEILLHLKEENRVAYNQKLMQKNDAYRQREYEMQSLIEDQEARRISEKIIRLNQKKLDNLRHKWTEEITEIGKNNDPYFETMQKAFGIIILD